MMYNLKLMDEEILVRGEGSLGVDGTVSTIGTIHQSVSLIFRQRMLVISSRVLVFIVESHRLGHRVDENDEKYLKKLAEFALPQSSCLCLPISSYNEVVYFSGYPVHIGIRATSSCRREGTKLSEEKTHDTYTSTLRTQQVFDKSASTQHPGPQCNQPSKAQ
jgi:hypothetical protein